MILYCIVDYIKQTGKKKKKNILFNKKIIYIYIYIIYI